MVREKNMPIITVELRRGRSLDQRREFAKRVTDAAVDTLDAKRERVRIRFIEFEKEEVARGGVLMSDESPG